MATAKPRTLTTLDTLVKNYATIDAQIKILEATKKTMRNKVIDAYKDKGITTFTASDGAIVQLVTAETINFDNVAMEAVLGRKFKDISVRVVDREKFKSATILGKFDGVNFGNALQVSCIDKLLVSGSTTGKLSFVIE